MVDCLGIFCFFSQGHHALPKACKSDPKSEECRRTLAKNQKYKNILSGCPGDTTKIEEAIPGGKGAKEYLTSLSKDIYEELHPASKKIPNDRRYRESDAPDIAGFIKLDRETIKKNHSLKRFEDLISSYATQSGNAI